MDQPSDTRSAEGQGRQTLTSAAIVTDRFRRLNYGHLELEITVDDPKAYTRPWSVTLHQDIAFDTELMKYFCTENEKDRSHMLGK
jgi:hypothetical protein